MREHARRFDRGGVLGLQCILSSSPTVQLCCTCYLSCLWLAIRNRLAQAICACMDQRTRIPRSCYRTRSHAPWRKAALQTAGRTQQYWTRQPRGDQEQTEGGQTESPPQRGSEATLGGWREQWNIYFDSTVARTDLTFSGANIPRNIPGNDVFSPGASIGTSTVMSLG